MISLENLIGITTCKLKWHFILFEFVVTSTLNLTTKIDLSYDQKDSIIRSLKSLNQQQDVITDMTLMWIFFTCFFIFFFVCKLANISLSHHTFKIRFIVLIIYWFIVYLLLPVYLNFLQLFPLKEEKQSSFKM